MSKSKFNILVAELVKQGSLGQQAIPNALKNENEAWKMLVCGDEFWFDLAAKLKAQQLVHLIRGLILYCKESGRQIGQSVSPVIVLYAVLVSRKSALIPDLTNWIIENRVNEYEPFGSLRESDARSYQDWFEKFPSQTMRILESREPMYEPD